MMLIGKILKDQNKINNTLIYMVIIAFGMLRAKEINFL